MSAAAKSARYIARMRSGSATTTTADEPVGHVLADRVEGGSLRLRALARLDGSAGGRPADEAGGESGRSERKPGDGADDGAGGGVGADHVSQTVHVDVVAEDRAANDDAAAPVNLDERRVAEPAGPGLAVARLCECVFCRMNAGERGDADLDHGASNAHRQVSRHHADCVIQGWAAGGRAQRIATMRAVSQSMRAWRKSATIP